MASVALIWPRFLKLQDCSAGSRLLLVTVLQSSLQKSSLYAFPQITYVKLYPPSKICVPVMKKVQNDSFRCASEYFFKFQIWIFFWKKPSFKIQVERMWSCQRQNNRHFILNAAKSNETFRNGHYKSENLVSPLYFVWKPYSVIFRSILKLDDILKSTNDPYFQWIPSASRHTERNQPNRLETYVSANKYLSHTSIYKILLQ